MPTDEGFYTCDEMILIQQRIRAKRKASIIENLKKKFDIPEEMEELAYEIWIDGKED